MCEGDRRSFAMHRDGGMSIQAPPRTGTGSGSSNPAVFPLFQAELGPVIRSAQDPSNLPMASTKGINHLVFLGEGCSFARRVRSQEEAIVVKLAILPGGSLRRKP